MLLLDATQLPGYLRGRGLLGASENCRVEALTGGVSNVVLRVEPPGRPAFVLKQSRERLQTEAPWFSRLDRIFRETAAMRVLGPLLLEGAIPRILDEDRENYAYAMEAVDVDHVVWKRELFSGRVREEIAIRLADYLSAIHGRTQGDPAIAQEFEDREIFVQLRVDPFYRHVARVHSDLRAGIERLIDEMWHSQICLVHGDFSPKNVLIVDRPSRSNASTSSAASAKSESMVTLVDFETAHYGDPAFDLGFFLSHLALKFIRAGAEKPRYMRLVEVFWNRYQERIAETAAGTRLQSPDLERRAVAHLAACALARIDGTSPVDYLPDPSQRDLVRAFSRRLINDPISRLLDAMGILCGLMAAQQAAPEMIRRFRQLAQTPPEDRKPYDAN
jgi:5-methylthioribose kinase